MNTKGVTQGQPRIHVIAVAVKRAQYLRACGACCRVVFEAAPTGVRRWIPVDRRAPGTTPPPDPVVAGVRIAPKPVEVWPPVVPSHRGRDPGGNAAGSVAIAPMLLRVCVDVAMG